MTQGIKYNEPDPEQVYADIFHVQYQPSHRQHCMSSGDRAAQFAPYAALSGYGDMVEEEARYVPTRTELEEYAFEQLDRKLNLIIETIASGEHPELAITYFVPDEKKAGGRYVTQTEKICRVDLTERRLILVRTVGRARSHATIALDDISEIHGALVDFVDDSIA